MPLKQHEIDYIARFEGRTHPVTRCAGRHCVIHNPSDHSMRDFPLNWRGDRGVMERICPHGIGHPDPDEMEYQHRKNPDGAWAEAVHGCDGCCAGAYHRPYVRPPYDHSHADRAANARNDADRARIKRAIEASSAGPTERDWLQQIGALEVEQARLERELRRANEMLRTERLSHKIEMSMIRGDHRQNPLLTPVSECCTLAKAADRLGMTNLHKSLDHPEFPKPVVTPKHIGGQANLYNFEEIRKWYAAHGRYPMRAEVQAYRNG